jgi:type IV secretory pathway VirB4 component
MNLPFIGKVKTKKDKNQQENTNQASVDAKNQKTAAEQIGSGMVSIQDVIAPESIDVNFNELKIGNTFVRTLFVAGYPRYVSANWLAPLINFEHSLNISMFIYPVEGREILDELRRKIGEMEAEIETDIKRGHIASVDTEIKLSDAKALQQELAKGAERFYQFGLYITLSANTIEELNSITKKVQSTLGSLLIISKAATLQMEDGFKTTLPLGQDYLVITRNMDTTSLATTFPFTSSELSANEGIMYGINEHNDSLIIFDRFTLENANMVIFGKSGSGKSFFGKLEILRSLR